MTVKGIRILDKDNRVVSVELPDILQEIHEGNLFHWSILYLDASGDLGEGQSIVSFEDQINNSENGLFIKWEDLNLLSNKFYQIIDIIILGCKDKKLLHRYENDQEAYETCDIYIEMHDSCFWEVFAKDENLIHRLSKKFKEIIFLKPDFGNTASLSE